MPKRGSDHQLTKDNSNDSDFNGEPDELTQLFWTVKDRPIEEQFAALDNYVKGYKGPEQGNQLRRRFVKLGTAYVEEQNMSKRATDAQLARRK